MAAKKVPDKKKTKARAARPARASGTKAERVVAATAPAADAEIAAASALAPPEAAPQAADASAQQQAQQQQQTTISTSRGFIDFLVTNRLSLALTSYQTGQLMLIGPLLDNRLSVFQRNFVRAMGLWASPQRLFLSSIAQIWRLENVLGAGQLATQQQLHYERLYVPRASHTTGDIDAHEIGVDANDNLIFVNTKYSCLATTDPVHSFRPIWKPSFISRLAAEDRCHLNGMAIKDGAPRFATAVSASDVADGWRDRRRDGGVLIDVQTGEIVVDGLSMPHSPRLRGEELWLLNSGTGELGRVDVAGQRFEPVAFCPGYARGLAFSGGVAIAGLSLARENRTFSGLYLDEALQRRGAEARCGLAIVDLGSGDMIHWVRIEGVVRELYDVAFISGVRRPSLIGFRSDEVKRIISVDD